MTAITPFKISTITATGCVNAEINLNTLFTSIDINPHVDEGVLYAELGSNKKGTSKKSNIQKRKIVETSKKFDNQLTLEYRMRIDTKHTILNCKIFKNGNVQMTGIKYVGQGSIFVDRIIDIIKHAASATPDIGKLENTNYLIRMINCDYKIGFPIKRDSLFKIMINDYDNMCSFEPCIYPGVKIQYMWNKQNKYRDGICKCNSVCVNGKGCGDGEANCKKITIAVFQSGCVIITGAQSEDQIVETYNWINDIIISNKNRIEKKNVVIPNETEASAKKIMIPKSKIISLRPLGSNDKCF